MVLCAKILTLDFILGVMENPWRVFRRVTRSGKLEIQKEPMFQFKPDGRKEIDKGSQATGIPFSSLEG